MSAPVSGASLRARVIRAAAWALGGEAAAQLLRLLSNLVMTRLLAPDMFGVMSVAFVFLTAVSMFSDVGLKQVVVRSPRGSDPAFLDTVWTVQIVRGALLCLMCLVVSGLIALGVRQGLFPAGSTYAHPSLPMVTAALAAAPLIAGFESTKLISANRSLSMRRIMQIELAAQMVGFVPMILWATLAPSIFALVCGALVAAGTRAVLSYTWLPGHANRLRWDSTCLREIREFGTWILLTSAMGFFIRMGDRVLLAWLLAAPVMGLYSIAAMMVAVPAQAVQKLISSVAFPALGEIQRSDVKRLSSAYYRIRFPIDAFCLMVGGAIFAGGGVIIDLLYDARYQEAGPMLEVLAVALFETRFEVAVQFYLVLGKSKLMAKLMAVRLASMAILIPVGFHVAGPVGAVWGIALAGMPGLLVTLLWVKPRLGIFDIRKELLALLFIPAGLGLGLAMSWLHQAWQGASLMTGI